MKYPAIEDDSSSLFDTPNMTGTPERRLLLAILERAILDYVGNDAREVEAARDWIFGPHAILDASEFSFSWVCHELDLDLDRIVKKIGQMPRRGSSRIAPWYVARHAVQANESDLKPSALAS